MNLPHILLNSRFLSALTAFGCIFLLAVALYMEHAMGLEPCPLCILQRGAVLAVGLIALAAAIHNPASTGIRIYAAGCVAAATAGAALSARQLWLQSLPADQVPACGPGLEYLLDVFPLTEVLAMVIAGDGTCAEVVWTFLGLSIPGWTLVGFLGLIGIAAIQLARPQRG